MADIDISIISSFNDAGVQSAINAVSKLRADLEAINKLSGVGGSGKTNNVAQNLNNMAKAAQNFAKAQQTMNRASQQAQRQNVAKIRDYQGLSRAIQQSTRYMSGMLRAETTLANRGRTLNEITTQRQRAIQLETQALRTLQGVQLQDRNAKQQLAQATRQLTQAQQANAGAQAATRRQMNAIVDQARAARGAAAEMRTIENSIHAMQQAGQRPPEGLLNRRQLLSESMQAYRQQFDQLRTHYRTLRTELAGLEAEGRRIGTGLQGAQQMTNQLRSMGTVSRTATSGLRSLASVTRTLTTAMRSALSAVRSLATSLLTGLARGATTAAAAMGRLSSAVGTRFTSLRTHLMSTGNAALMFGNNMRRGMSMAGNSLNSNLAGWSLLLGGLTMRNAGQRLLSGNMLNIDEFMGFERAANRAAIAGNVPISAINDLVFGLQRGTYGTAPLRMLSSEQMAQGAYYLTSAVGLDVSEFGVRNVAQMLAPMLQVAQYTQTEPSTMIPGVLNLGMQFGYDPRQPRNIPQFQNIAATMGYLANETTMEVTDVIEAFNKMGPMMNRLVGGGAGQGMEDAMAFTYFASEVGLRGGQVGRSLDRFVSQLLAPAPLNIFQGSKAFGFEPTEEGWYDFWFDDQMNLRGGLLGVLEKFMDPAMGAESDKLLAQLFTQNATRGSLGVVAALQRDISDLRESPQRWEEVRRNLEEGTFAMELLDRATQTTDQTVSAAMQNMQNAWMQFTTFLIGSIHGPLTSTLDTVANIFREIADVFREYPQIGRFFAALVAGAGVVLTLVGSLLTLAGVIFVLQRGLSLTGSASGLFFGFLAAIPHVLLMSIPLLLALAAAAILLRTAWQENFLGIQDFANALTGDFSQTISSRAIPVLERFTERAARVGRAFEELVNGIFLGIGGTRNLGAFLRDVFGDLLGGTAYEQLLNFGQVMTRFRRDVRSFFTDLQNMPSLADFWSTALSFAEEFFFGITDLQRNAAVTRVGDWLGIDNFGARLQDAAATARTFANGLFDAVIVPIREIRANLRELFDADLASGFFEFLRGFAQGVGVGVAGTILAIANAIEFLTEQILRIDDAGGAVADFIEELTGLRLGIEEIGLIAGTVFGVLLTSRLLMAVPVVSSLTTAILNLGLGLVSTGIQVALLAARFALLTVAAVASATASLVAFAPLAALILAIGAALVIAIGHAYGWGDALAFLQGFFTSLRVGALLLLTSIGTLVEVVSTIGGAFGWVVDVTDQWRALGIVIGALVSAAILSLVPGLSTVISLMGMATMRAPWAALGVTIMALDGPLTNLIQKLGVTENSARNMANVLTSTLGGAALGFQFGGPWGALIGGATGLAVSGLPLIYDYATSGGAPVSIDNDKILGAAAKRLRDQMVQNTQSGTRVMSGNESYGVAGAQSAIPDTFIKQVLRNPTLFFEEYYRQNATGFKWTSPAPFGVLTGFEAIPPEAFNPNTLQGMVDFLIKEGVPASAATRAMATVTQRELNTPLTPQTSRKLLGGMYRVDPTTGGFIVDEQGNFMPQVPVVPGSTFTVPQWTKGDILEQTLAAQQPVVPYDFSGQGMTPSAAKWHNDLLDELARLNIDTDIANGLGESALKWAEGLGISWENGEVRFDPTKLSALDDTIFNTLEPRFQRDIEAINQSIASGEPVDAEAYADLYAGVLQQMEEHAQAVSDQVNNIFSSIPEMDMVDAARAAFYREPAHSIEEARLRRSKVSGGEAVMTYADQIIQNAQVDWDEDGVIDTGQWLNPVELLMDAAISGTAGRNVAGKNLHKALAPTLQVLSEQTGIAVSDLLEGVPRFIADRAYQPMAASIGAGLVESLGPELGRTLDTLGAGVFEDHGLDWVDFYDYTIAQSALGADWTFADYIAEAWGLEISEAEQYLRDNGIDPTVLTSEDFEPLRRAIMVGMDGVSAVYQDSLTDIGEQSLAVTDDIIALTEDQFMALDEATRIGLTNLGYTFMIVDDMFADLDFANAQAAVQQMQGMMEEFEALDQMDISGPDYSGLREFLNFLLSNDVGGIATEWMNFRQAFTPFDLGTTEGAYAQLDYEGMGADLSPDFDFYEWYFSPDSSKAREAANAILDDFGIQMQEGISDLEITFDPQIKAEGLIAQAEQLGDQARQAFTRAFNGEAIRVLPGTGTGSTAGGGWQPVVSPIPMGPIAPPPAISSPIPLGPLMPPQVAQPTDVTVTVNLVDNASAELGNLIFLANFLGAIAPTPVVSIVDNASAELGNLIFLAQFFGGLAPTPPMSIVDNASAEIGNLIFLANHYGGLKPSATMNVVDNASSVISGAISLLNSFGGVRTARLVTIYETQYVSNGTNVGFTQGGFAAEGGYHSGWTIVGEEGPELVRLPSGSFVYTAQETQAMLLNSNSRLYDRSSVAASQGGGGGVHIHGDINISSEVDADRFFERLNRLTGQHNRRADRSGMPVDSGRYHSSM